MPSKSKHCPICEKAETLEFAPFCSRGCKDRDLLQWLGDGYRIPGPSADPYGGPQGLDSGEADR